MVSVQGLSSAVLDTAKGLGRYKNVCHGLTFLCAAASIFLNEEWLYALALVALLSGLSAWFLTLGGQNKKSLGQELLRLNILKQAFGARMSIDTAYLKMRASGAEYEKAERLDVPNYYAANGVKPGERLKAIMQESCFWTQHLYKTCRNRAVVLSVLLAVVVCVFAVCSVVLYGVDTNYSISRLSLLLFMFFPIWNGIGDAIDFDNASAKLTLIDHRLDSDPKDGASVLSIFTDYNVVISSAPLIPQVVYEKEKVKLNLMWKERSG